MLDPEIFDKLVVLAEGAASGIWLAMPGGLGSLDYKDLGLPQDLRDRFIKWMSLYVDATYDDNWDPDEFNEIGRNLAKDLKSFVGPDIVVEFIREPSNTEEASVYLPSEVIE